MTYTVIASFYALSVLSRKGESMSPKKKKQTSDYRRASGPVAIKMTNDYLFKALMQENKRVLKALICSLLHLKPKDVHSVTITNPIILGKSVDEKDIILDINVIFNNSKQINLEMQVVNESNWPERSTYYACLNFTTLNKGQDYDEVIPLYQIGILDFTPIHEHPKFYSTYQLSDTEDHYIYTDKFNISVLDLTQINLASPTDKAYNIDIWASLFKAKTWEDIKMLAAKNKVIDDAAGTIYELSADEDFRLRCLAREDYEKRQRSLNRRIKKAEDALAESEREIAELKAKLSAYETNINTAGTDVSTD